MNKRKLRWLSWFLLTCLALTACKPIKADENAHTTPRAGQVDLTLTLMDGDERARYAQVEFTIDGLPTVANPFDPSEAALQINLTSPNGATVTVGGFWYQEFAGSGIQPQGEPGWRARFTPTVNGDWRAIALLEPHGLVSNEVRFTVTSSASPGFIRVDPADPRYFAYDDGTRFFPIGINMGWWNDDPIENYTRWLDHFAANGGNTIRVWMANWAFALEWNDTPLGDYRPRMRQAWLLDELLRLADARGVKVILVLNHHGQFSRTVNPQWSENPYNAALGGPLVAPEQFATDPVAIALFQQRLRYIVDRWGAAPNLFAWEWWNEYNFTTIDDRLMEAWLTNVDAYLAMRDPYNHLVTISGPAGPNSPIWQLPGIDFVSVHIYSTTDPLHFAAELAREYTRAIPDKPLVLAEFGFATGEESVDSHDKTGIHLHNGLWAALFSGHAGSGMYWWWDTYVEPLDLWYHFGALDHFLASLDPAHFEPGAVTIKRADDSPIEAEALRLAGNDQHLLWVRSKQFTAIAVEEAYNTAVRNALRNRETLGDFVFAPPPISGHFIVIDDIEAGRYKVTWFDTENGTWEASEDVDAEEGTMMLPLPNFSRDIAAHIVRLP